MSIVVTNQAIYHTYWFHRINSANVPRVTVSMSYSATMVRVSREYVHVVSSSLVKSFRLIVLTIVQAPALFQVNKHSRIAGGFLHYTQPHKDRKANFGWE